MTTYNVLNPHPKFIEACLNAGYEPHAMEPDMKLLREPKTFAAMGDCTMKTLQYSTGEKYVFPEKCRETQEHPIKRKVVRLARVVTSGQEYLLYWEYLQGTNWLHTPLEITRMVGRYKLPIFNHIINPATKQKSINELDPYFKIEEQYEIPFGKEFIDPSTGEKTTLEDLLKLTNDKTEYQVWASDKRYGLRGITADDFVNRSAAELVEYGKTLRWPEPKRGKQ